MRRLKVNKKSLLQKGGTPAPQMTMDTDSILQGIREKLQGGVSEIEVFQNLMDQQIPLDEIQTAFTTLGYDDTMLSNIMTKIKDSADTSTKDIQEGNVQNNSLAQAQFGLSDLAALSPGNFGNPAFRGTVSTGNIDPTTGYRPARGTYLQQDLYNQGNLAGAIGVLAEGANRLFSGEDQNNDGVMDGVFRDGRAKRKRHKDRRGGYYDYEIKFDENDPNQDNYNLNYKDLYKGNLRTNEQYAQDVLDNSMINYNVDTGQYDTMISADKIRANRGSNSNKIAGNKDDRKNFLNNSISFADFQQRLKDNPAHAELLAQDLGLLKNDKLPPGVSYGVDKDGAAGSYMGENPYLYDTMMGNNLFRGDASKDYQLSDFNLEGTSLRSSNTNSPSNNPPSNNPPSSDTDYGYLDPTLNTMFDFEQTLGGFDDVTGKAYGLDNLGANRYTTLDASDPDYLDKNDPNFRANLRERVKRDYGSALQGFDKSMQPAMLDFAYNTGADPRIYLLDQYIKSQGNTAGLDNRGAYKDAMDNFSWTDANLQKNFNQVYGDNASKISALPVADQIKLMNQGRQFYYNNINMVNNQPNPAAAATWLKRPFYKAGGSLPKAQGGFDLKGYFSGEQGFIPDYKGESTTKTVNNAVDKYGDAVSTGLDVMQTGMTAAGMVPVVGNVVDLVNTGVSGARSAYAGFTGDTDGAVKHAENAAINAASAIPGVGIGIGGAGLVKDVAGYTGVMNDKSIASNVGIQTERPLVDTPVTSGPTKTLGSRGYEIPRYQQAGELGQAMDDEDLWLQQMSNPTPNSTSRPSIYDLVVSGDLPRLEDRVNEELGGTMTRGSRLTDIPGYLTFHKAKQKLYTSDEYQNLENKLNVLYNDPNADPDEIDELYSQMTSMEDNFKNSKLGKLGQKMESFYFKNQDPLRHGTTSGLTARAISDKIKNVPYIGGLLDFVGVDDAAGVVGANLLGLGHEASAYMDYGQHDGRSLTTELKESGKDMYNNFLGSLASIGSDTDQEVANKVIGGVKLGKYTSGVQKEDLTKAPEYQDGGANTLYEYYSGMDQNLPSISDRRTMFQDADLGQQYSGTAAQNTQLLEYLKNPVDNNVEYSDPQASIELDEYEFVEDGNNSMPTNDDPQDFSLFKDPVGPLANNDQSDIIRDPGQLQANLVNNQAMTPGDGSGNLTDDGTATTQITDFSVISDADTTVPNPTAGTEEDEDPTDPTDPDFKDPKVKRKNKIAGRIQQFMDSPGMEKFSATSEFAVAGANVVNEYFKGKNKNIALNEITNKRTADDIYGMQLDGADGSRGLFDEKTGIAQPDNIRAYEAQMGRETFMMPPMKQEQNIVDLDYETVAKLISAGADIEIL